MQKNLISYASNVTKKLKRVAGFPLDNMTHLGEMLLKKKEQYPDEVLILFKSDISEAYRHLPMHPLLDCPRVGPGRTSTIFSGPGPGP
jgi:hypothetical protein